MAESLFNPAWYRVANLSPRLREHAQIHRQSFRGEIWYVLQDHQSGRYHRLSSAANLMLSLMDGKRSLEEIWNLCGSKFIEDPPSQGDVIRLLAQLHANDLLRGDVPPDFSELASRARDARQQEVMGRIKNPLALRLPLFNPDRFLSAVAPIFRPIVSVWGLLAWCALVALGLILAALNWRELSSSPVDQLISAGNILLLLLTYPVLKLLHEFGHAIVTKAFGGRVFETGVMLLVFMPAPYVDATSATAFASKWQRIAVSAAGIMVEFGLAALAMIFWAFAEPGFLRAMAFNVMLIGSVSTILFNGNPLLRFDAFYMLMDWLEIPNLATRANRYVFFLVQKHLLGLKEAVSPATGEGEEKWLLGYAITSWLYRTSLSLTIALLIASKFFFVGILLAIVVLYGVIFAPLLKGIKFLVTTPAMRGKRKRAFLICTGAVALSFLLLCVLPLPYASTVEGIVSPPSGSEQRSAAAGEIVEVFVPPNSIVTEGTALVALTDPLVEAEMTLLNVQREGLLLQREAVLYSDRVRASILAEQIRNIEGALATLSSRSDDLIVRANHAGTFILPNAGDLIGRHVQQGQVLGYVVPERPVPVRAVVTQSNIDLVRKDTRSASLHYRSVAPESSPFVPASVLREVPAAQVDLPSLALSREAGGAIVTSGGANGPQAIEGLFIFDLQPETASATPYLGARVDVRFEHSPSPLIGRILRAMRQLFLSYFNV